MRYVRLWKLILLIIEIAVITSIVAASIVYTATYLGSVSGTTV